jgi:hypothetical protein
MAQQRAFLGRLETGLQAALAAQRTKEIQDVSGNMRK